MYVNSTTGFVVIHIMADVIALKKRLVKFGIAEKQAEIYVLLLRQGNLRISDIVSALQMPRSSVYESLKGLFEIGLAEEVIENSFKRIRAYPIGSLKHHLDENMLKIQKQAEDLTHLEKIFDILPGLPMSSTTTVRYYKGVAGARQLFWNTLKSKNTTYVYSEWGRSRYLGIEFYKNFVAESRDRGFQEQVITNSTPRVLNSIKQHLDTPVSRTKLENIRFMPIDKIALKGDSFMYDDIYAQIFLKDGVISGFEIQSEPFVKTQRAIFETLWDTAQPVSSLR